MGDKQEPNKIQECFRTIIAQVRAGERVLRKGPAGARAATGVPEGVANGTAGDAGASDDPAAGVAGAVAGTGTRAARALSVRS